MSGKVIPVVRAEEEEEELVDPQTQLRVSYDFTSLICSSISFIFFQDTYTCFYNL